MDLTDNELENRFKYHPPSNNNIASFHEVVRHELHKVAQQFNDILPHCRESSLAITKLEEAMFWANAAIARNQLVAEKQTEQPNSGS